MNDDRMPGAPERARKPAAKKPAAKKKTAKKKTAAKKKSTALKLSREEKTLVTNYRKCSLIEKKIFLALVKTAAEGTTRLTEAEISKMIG